MTAIKSAKTRRKPKFGGIKGFYTVLGIVFGLACIGVVEYDTGSISGWLRQRGERSLSSRTEAYGTSSNNKVPGDFRPSKSGMKAFDIYAPYDQPFPNGSRNWFHNEDQKNCTGWLDFWQKEPVGGLGNRMFNFASMYAFGRKYNMKQTYRGFFDIGYFPAIQNLSKPIGTVRNVQRRLNPGRPGSFAPPQFFQALNNCNSNYTVATGLLHSWKYFHPIRHEIRRLFNFSTAVQNGCDRFIQQVKTERYTSIMAHNHHTGPGGSGKNQANNIRIVAFHLRRGDFTGETEAKHGHLASDANFTIKAWKFVKKRIIEPSGEEGGDERQYVPLMITDDVQWAERAFKGRIPGVQIPYQSELDGLCYLTRSDVIILTASGSTFGWWGAYLNNNSEGTGGDGRVVTTLYRHQYAVSGSKAEFNIQRMDRFLPNWIPLKF